MTERITWIKDGTDAIKVPRLSNFYNFTFSNFTIFIWDFFFNLHNFQKKIQFKKLWKLYNFWWVFESCIKNFHRDLNSKYYLNVKKFGTFWILHQGQRRSKKYLKRQIPQFPLTTHFIRGKLLENYQTKKFQVPYKGVRKIFKGAKFYLTHFVVKSNYPLLIPRFAH